MKNYYRTSLFDFDISICLQDIRKKLPKSIKFVNFQARNEI